MDILGCLQVLIGRVQALPWSDQPVGGPAGCTLDNSGLYTYNRSELWWHHHLGCGLCTAQVAVLVCPRRDDFHFVCMGFKLKLPEDSFLLQLFNYRVQPLFVQLFTLPAFFLFFKKDLLFVTNRSIMHIRYNQLICYATTFQQCFLFWYKYTN
jgi:hypothetical protein